MDAKRCERCGRSTRSWSSSTSRCRRSTASASCARSVRTHAVGHLCHRYDAFAVRAFDAHAIDYLVKPLREARFAEAVQRVRERLRSADAVTLSRQLSALLATTDRRASVGQAADRATVVVPTSTGELVLDAEEIDWIEADDYYAAVHTRGRRHLIRESLSSLEARLDPARFVRVHRSAIINLDRVREYRADAQETVRGAVAGRNADRRQPPAGAN